MLKFIYLLLISFVVAGCMGKTPVTGREQVIFISPSKEKALGEKSYKEFLAKAKLSTDKKQTARVKRIGNRIAKVANRPDFNWEFNLVQNDQMNAFCLPGGKVIVYTGILKVAKNDDQLATVMSHEIAHALARHGAERMSHQQIANILGSIGSIALNSYHPEYTSAFNLAYGAGVNYGVMLPFSRSQESEADAIGIHLMYRAGYNIHEAVKFWKNMQKLQGGKQTNEFFSTHPSDERRIHDITLLVKKLSKNNSF